MPDCTNISAEAPDKRWLTGRFLLLALLLLGSVGSAVAQSPAPQPTEDLPATPAEEPPGALDQVADPEADPPAPAEPPAAFEVEPVDAPEVPVPVEPPESPSVSTGERVMIFEDLVLAENERAREVVVILGSLDLEGSAREVVVVGGSARVEGEVDREIVVVGGSLYLGPESRVGRDVVVVGGRLERAPGSQVGGAVNRVNAGPFLSDVDWDDFDVDVDWGPTHRIWSYPVRVFWHLMKLAVLALLVCFVFLVAPQAVERVERQVRAEPLKAGLIGLALALLLAPLTVLFLIATFCLGLLALPFLALGLVLVMLVGYTAVALRLGRWLRSRDGRINLASPYAAIAAGVLLIEGWELLSILLSVGWLSFFAWLIGVVAATIEAVAWLVGLGAVVMSWMEQRRSGAALPPPAVPPPPGGVDPLDDDLYVPPAPRFPTATDPAGPPAAPPATAPPVTPVAPVAPVAPVTPETAYAPDPAPPAPESEPSQPEDERLPGQGPPSER